jgi:hypothetical protein
MDRRPLADHQHSQMLEIGHCKLVMDHFFGSFSTSPRLIFFPSSRSRLMAL